MMATFRTHHRWTEQDDKQLRELAKAGKSIKEISEVIGRPPGSVRNRAMLQSIAIARAPHRLRMKINRSRSG
jgi:hypothetical protein